MIPNKIDAANDARVPDQGSVAKPALQVILTAPRGFCAGVDRAIQIVELALERFGAPVYVRHEIVHNRYVVEQLEQKGAVFVEELDDVPADVPVIFSAHGVPKSVPAAAEARKMLYVDATCPLVSKVHVEAERHYARGLEIILIGHAGHPEVEGTMGQLPPDAIRLIETPEDARTFTPKDPTKVAFITQTTLSVDDTAEIVDILQSRFPEIAKPHKEDICYATTNRQEAVKAIAARCDGVLVVGAPNSSNSMRLVEVATRAGAPKAQLVQRADDLDPEWLEGMSTLGITAGASAPEILVREVIDVLEQHFNVSVVEDETRREDVQFKLPRILTDAEGDETGAAT